MAQILSSFTRDANGVPISTEGLVVSKTVTFDGATTNDPGDLEGTGNPHTLFTVTGDVIVRCFAVCTVSLTGASATVAIGITGNTGGLIAATTGTNIDAGQVWVDTSTASIQPLPSAQVLTNGTDIIQTVATADVTAGSLTYYCIWTPLSSTGNVVAA